MAATKPARTRVFPAASRASKRYRTPSVCPPRARSLLDNEGISEDSRCYFHLRPPGLRGGVAVSPAFVRPPREGCGSGLRAARSRRLASARCRAEPAAGALLGRDAPPRDHRDRLAGTTAYALEATVVLDIIHVAAATRRAVLVVGSSKGLSAFGPRPDGSRPAHGDTWLQLRRFSAAAGSRSLDAY